MRTFNKNKCQASLFLLFIFATYSQAQNNIYDDFESSKISDIWSVQRMESHSFEIQSAIVRNGNSAAKITLQAGDMAAEGSGKDLPTERDELTEIELLHSREGIRYEYKFSLFLPDSFPIVPVRLVIAQWKQNCPRGLPCNKYSPIIAIRYMSGRLSITLQTDAIRRTLCEIDEDIRNQWLDFKFQIRFSRQSDGEVLAYLNEKEIVNYNGITSYAEKPYEINTYYFKMGLYRDRMLEPMSIYIDDYRKKEIIE